jgi:hypothetical protein
MILVFSCTGEAFLRSFDDGSEHLTASTSAVQRGTAQDPRGTSPGSGSGTDAEPSDSDSDSGNRSGAELESPDTSSGLHRSQDEVRKGRAGSHAPVEVVFHSRSR